MPIELMGLIKSYASKIVLSGLDLRVEDGEVAAILGPSGCGKTSLLRVIASMEPYQGGRVSGLEGKRISFVFQEPRLLSGLSALDNVVVALRGAMGAREARRKALRSLDMVGLGKQLDKRPAQLSGGMRQRVSLARAFAFPSDILLMDEPFQSLDIGLRSSLLDAFIRLWEEEPRTVLFVTHDPDEALYLGDSLHVMGGDPARVVKSLKIPGLRGRRILMQGPLLDTERDLYMSLIGREGLWTAGLDRASS